MKCFYFFPAILLFVFLTSESALSQSWTWVSGTSTSTIVADFGTRGQFSPSNQPPALKDAAIWSGPDGKIYLFGGDNGGNNYYNTIWIYDPDLDQWMWKRGANTPNASRVLGATGYPSETNDPGARTGFAWSATSNGDLWIYGGIDPGSNLYSDMWKYDFALDRWIRYYVTDNNSAEEGTNVDVQHNSLGSLGIPGGRAYSAMYYDEDSSKAWLFMGQTFIAGSPCSQGDIWKLDPVNHVSRWAGGYNNPDDGGNYPINYNIEYTNNSSNPPSRYNHSLWKASNGKFYIFGGRDGASNLLCDLWSWNPANNGWTWATGENISNRYSVYHALGVAELIPSTQQTNFPINNPGGRYGAQTWITPDGKLAIYGGFGYSTPGGVKQLNDLFIFDPVSPSMIWVGGGLGLDTLSYRRPVFGVRGIAADSITPGIRSSAATMIDKNGKVWMFGGMGYASDASSATVRNDLFSYSVPATNIFAGGKGTAGDPYQIAALSQLQSVADYLDQHFILTADIDASPTSTWNFSGGVYKGFVPIGTNAHPFTGTFSGNGHTISHLYINRGSTSAVGFIGRLEGEVKDLLLDSVEIIGDSYVGGITGRDLGLIERCSVTGTVTGSGIAVGGVAGDLFSGSMKKSYSEVNVMGGVYLGIGAGGLAGSVSSGSTISNCYATGTVTGDERVGGLVGNNDGSISLCYSIGTVTGNGEAGGLIGKSSGLVTGSFWNTASSGLATSAGGTGKNSLQMQQQGTFAGFDFGITWVIWEGLTSPAFRNYLQSNPPGSHGTAMTITRNDSVYQFDRTHVKLSFTGIGADSTLYLYVQFDTNAVANVSFAGTPPLYYSGYRWIIARTGTVFSNATVTINDIDSLAGVPNDPSIKLYFRSTIGTGNFSHVPSSYGGDSLSAVVSAFGEYILGSDSSSLDPLMMELASFTGRAVSNTIELQWTTTTEINNYGFTVERQYDNDRYPQLESLSKNWEQASFINGMGTSNVLQEYSFIDKNLKVGMYSYRLKQIDHDGKYKYSPQVKIEVGKIPNIFLLEQNYPNPFNPTTTIGFTLQVSGITTLKIYDAIGREVATLVNENLEAGVYHQKTFDASRLSSGIYFARLSSEGKSQVKKLMLIR